MSWEGEGCLVIKCLMWVLSWLRIKNTWRFVDCIDKEMWFRVKDGF